MAWMSNQVSTGVLRIGEITDQADLEVNLKESAIPDFIDEVTGANYPEFLEARRKLMADMIREYYKSL
ncbi:hypothetical protein [Wenzhouxiangella sp. XN79A]|uniref:hypothetical protein n=1 Tax=Wenzhouxiangella sp. XN79A TaxID=2724193 RepID=UPI0019815018|nr:hypothetical protein [Wenzhouxiangella sp. XN79A]